MPVAGTVNGNVFLAMHHISTHQLSRLTEQDDYFILLLEVCVGLTTGSTTLGGAQNVNMATLGGLAASRVVCSGDALKSCTLSKDNQATIDVQSAGPGQCYIIH